jgi:hypothetical protein
MHMPAAEKHIDAATHIRGQKSRPGLALDRGGIRREPPVVKRRLHLRAPRAPEFAPPVQLKRGHILALQKPGDLARAADDAPVDDDAFSGAGPIPFRKPAPELVADGLIVRSDDDQRAGIRVRAARAFLRTQQERQRDDKRQRCNNNKALGHDLLLPTEHTEYTEEILVRRYLEWPVCRFNRIPVLCG